MILTMRKLMGLLLTLSLIIPIAQAQHLEQRLDKILTTKLSHLAPGVTMLVSQQGEVIYHRVSGTSDLENNVPLKINDIFRIGSLTKQFTALAILKLSESKNMTLDQDIRMYVPEFLPQGPTITIKHLLTHTSGIVDHHQIPGYEKEFEQGDKSPRSLIRQFEAVPLLFAPGNQFLYSNLNYILLGHIIELVSGMSYEQYLNMAFFKPLELGNTCYENADNTNKRPIKGHSMIGENFGNAAYLDMRLPHGAGALISNASDLHNWYRALFSDKVVSREHLKEFAQPYNLPNGEKTSYGLGIKVEPWKNRRILHHDGIINGFVSYAGYLPEQQIFVTILTNCDCTGVLDAIAKDIYSVVLGDTAKAQKVKLSKQDLLSYQGIYSLSNDQSKHITYQAGTLMYHDKGGMKQMLIPLGNDAFELDGNQGKITFGPNRDAFVVEPIDDKSEPIEGWRSDTTLALTPIEIKEEQIQAYIGAYEFPGAFTFHIGWDGEDFYGQVGNDRKKIVAYDTHKFYAEEMDAKLIFAPDPDGNLTDLTMIQAREMKAKRVK